MNPEINELGRSLRFVDDENIPIISEFYPDQTYDPDELVNSGGIDVKTDKYGKRYYTIQSSIDTESLELIRIILKYPSLASFTAEGINFIRPDFMVFPNGMAEFRIAQDPKLLLTPKGVILKDEDAHDEVLVRRNFMPGKNPTSCPLNGVSHYRYQWDNLIKDHPVFELEGVKYGAHIQAGIYLSTLSPRANREDLEILRRNGLLQNNRIRERIKPYFGIKLFALDQQQS